MRTVENTVFQQDVHHRFPGCGERGTVLLATVIVVFVIAAMSAVMMTRSQNNVNKYRQQKRASQSQQMADSAMTLAMRELNRNLLPANPTPGSMHGSSVQFDSGDPGHSPIVPPGASDRGDPEHDRMPNSSDLFNPGEDDVNSKGHYKGALYRITVEEWNTPSQNPDKVGAMSFDEDGDGNNTDAGDASSFSDEDTRHFTVEAEITYGNFYIKKRAIVSAEQVESKGYGVFSFGDLQIQPNGVLDSFDSDSGSYAGTCGGCPPNRQNISIGSTGNLSVKPNTDVYGDARCGSCTAGQSFQGNVHGDSGPLTRTPPQTQWSLSRDFKTPAPGSTVTVTNTATAQPISTGIYEQVNFGGGTGSFKMRKEESMLARHGNGLDENDTFFYHPAYPTVHPLSLAGSRIPQHIPDRTSSSILQTLLGIRPLPGTGTRPGTPFTPSSRPFMDNTIPLGKGKGKGGGGGGGGGGGSGPKAKILAGATVTLGKKFGSNSGLVIDASGSKLTVGSQATVYIQGDLDVGQNTTVVFHGPKDPKKQPTRIYVAGDFKGKKMGTFKVRGRVQLNIANKFHMGNNAGDIVVQEHFKNGAPYARTDRAPWFSVNVGGTWSGSSRTVDKDGRVTLKPNSGIFTGILNAPDASQIKILPKSDIYGAVVGKNMTPPAFQPMGNLHYDERLKKSCHLNGVHCQWTAMDQVSWTLQREGGPLNK